jgi:broad specificity phosphatase PhoE
MSLLRRIVMVRHGETEGQSSIRFHGSADVPLSDEGRAQLRKTARTLGTEFFDLVVASPLQRSWEGAAIVTDGAPVRLESGFREVNFGRWEGMTAQEIEASDPALYQDWQADAANFEYPGGELRADFRARVIRGLESVMTSGATSALLVVHRGVIRTIGEQLVGETWPDGPELGGVVSMSRGVGDAWIEGRRGSDPAGIGD